MQQLIYKLMALFLVSFSLPAVAIESVATNTIQSIAAGSYEIGNSENLPIVLTQGNSKNEWAFTDVTNLTGHAYFNATKCSNGLCILAGATEDTSGYNRAPLIVVNDGKEWQLSKINSLPTMVDGFMNSLVCSSSACVAGGFYQHTNGSAPLILTSDDTGKTWSAVTKIENLSAIDHSNIESVTCEKNTCLAVGYSKTNNYREKPLILKSDDLGQTWSAVSLNDLPALADSVSLHRVKCHESVCTAVGDYGNYASSLEYPLVMVSNDAGITWNIKSIAKMHLKNKTMRLNDVTVVDQNWIIAGNYASSVGVEKTLLVISHDNGATWVTQDGASLSGTLEAISCNDQVCATAGTANYYNRGKYLLGILISKDKGNTWETISSITDFDTQYAHIEALKCSQDSCIATGSFNTESIYKKPLILTSNKNGGDWIKVKTIPNLPEYMYEVTVKALTY